MNSFSIGLGGKSPIKIAMAVLFAVIGAAVARGQDSGANGDIQQSVARISFLSGDVSFNRGDDPDTWQAAAVNVPMTIGDRLYLRGESRAELQLDGGSFVRLGAQSEFSVLNLTDDVQQFSLQSGTVSFRIGRLENQQSFEVDTPNVAVTFEQPGDYRLDVDQDGNSRVAVRSGQALVAAGGGQVPLSAGSEMDITGTDAPQYDIVALPAPDAWDGWVDQRGARFTPRNTVSYVNAGVVGAQDLDQYGQWSDVPQYGHVWSPASVGAGWQPYQAGRWGWQDPWGWTWIADEPWGWAPYHYGRWVTASSRWYWVPDAPSAGYVHYSPALVGFVGGGPGWSASFVVGGGGYVGWFPLAPRDPFNPWWGSHDHFHGNESNVTYVNRRYVTVTTHDTFVSGGGHDKYVRDPAVLRQITAAPVLRGALPVMPVAGALRVSRTAGTAVRPAAQVSSRPVVTRLAPPPAPPSFQSKVAAIREQHGAPVTAAAAARISIQSNQGARAPQPVRPAAAPSGDVTFRARSSNASTPRPQPVTAPRGKVLATTNRPIVSSPAAAARPDVPAPARIAPNAVVAPGSTGKEAPERHVTQPLAPRGQSTPPKHSFEAPPPKAQDNSHSTSQQHPSPKQSFEPPPPKPQDNSHSTSQPHQSQPLAPREQSPPPKHSVEPPPEHHAPPQGGSETHATPPGNRPTPPPAHNTAKPVDHSKSRPPEKQDQNKKKDNPKTSSEEPPPKTR